jgi:hypothetical protein
MTLVSDTFRNASPDILHDELHKIFGSDALASQDFQKQCFSFTRFSEMMLQLHKIFGSDALASQCAAFTSEYALQTLFTRFIV